MRATLSFFAMALWAGSALAASEKVQETVRSAEALEWKGDAAGARALLEQAAHGSTDNADAILAYADFLAVHHDPAARHEYARALSAFAPERREDRQNAARRLVLLDLVDGDRDAARRDLEAYRAAGGDHWAAGVPADAPAGPAETIELPGPLRSFARMAALAPDVAPADLLPALARNVVTNGYRAAGGDVLEPTEYLKLTTRYLAQARELAHLAGDRAKILVPACDSAEAGDLLRILGYRMRGACGGDVVLETVNAGRAFLTIDSGFPVADLEQALRTNRKFEYPYSPTRVPILYGAAYWLSPVEKDSQFIDALLGDPMLCRIYLGLSKLDPETADALRQAAPFERLKAFAHVLDFYGGMFEVRGGKAVTPGGARAEAAWADLVGVPPAQGGAFFAKIVSKDDGWMASYFDALARIEGPVQEYLTEPQRMKRFYTAIRGRVTSPGPARPVFRANTDMMLLTTRLRLDPDGLPHIPGGLEVWKGLFAGRAFAKLDPRLSRAAPNWKAPDDLLEAMFGLCRKSFDNAPIAVFMNLSDLDRRRARPLDPATAQRLATDYAAYGSQYTLFSEEPSVSDRTILQYLDTARALTHIGDVRLRVDLAATFQALAGLWQIFCRQGFIPPDAADATLAGIVTPFTEARTERDLFDAGRAGVNLLLKAAGGSASAAPQDSILNLLAGAGNTSDSETQARVVQDMVRILEAQKLVSLDALFGLADNLDAVARGEKLDTALVGRVSARVAEIQVPWAALTSQEKGAMAVGDAVERHIEMEHRLNLKAVIERAQGGADRLRDVRGSLAPLLRDTLVGLNYVYYAPPGAEVLLTNPVFVRGHDFAGTPMQPLLWQATWPASAGWPSNAGGRLNGSLCGLPYALAAAEQDFMIPVREQALIWDDLAPQIIQSATIPRWWSVTPAELHWVALHLRYGESLVAESVLDAALRRQISGLLERQVPPARARKVDELIERGDVRAALDNIAPSELFMLARRMAPSGRGAGALADEIARMQRETPARIGYEEVSRDFGTPKPTLTGSYRPELLYLRTFPALMGYSSRILAESWESTLLYWAALADEVHAPPSQLNVLIPEWTERTIEQIFATHLEDWPALLRSLRNVGEDVRAKARARMETEQKASLD